MAYASLLVHVEDDSPVWDARVELAAGLAKRFHARLTGLCSIAPSYIPPDDIVSVALSRSLMQEDEQRARKTFAAAEGRFRTIANNGSLKLDWRSTVDEPEAAIVREALGADLVIVGRPAEGLGPEPLDVGEVLLSSGRPLLLVPLGVRALSLRSVVIFWKDTREARGAVWDALPLLEMADSVFVVAIEPGRPSMEATESLNGIVTYLHRHGVKARGECRALSAATEAEDLLLCAQQQQADLLVAGAYGHSRLREWALGGVTQALLERATACCFLSH